jgi:hypothetical protein
MTITVVSGLVGKPVEKVVSANSQASPYNHQQQPVAQAAQQAAAAQSANSDAVRVDVRSARSSDRGEPIQTYSRAKKTADDAADRIRSDEGGEALGAHQGLNPATAKPAEM